MHPKPVIARWNTLTKQSPANIPAALYPSQMTLSGANYIAGSSAAPTPPKSNMQLVPGVPNPVAAQRPYLAAETAMMQDALKIAALKTAEIIRYMSTARRVHGVSQISGPPAALTNELRKQLARYDQLCDIVETRLIRAHAALSARLKRERAANPQQPIQIDSPMSDDVPLSLSNNGLSAPTSTIQYVAPPKARGLSSLAAQRPSNSLPDPTRILSPVTLASNASIMSSLDSIPSHHAVVPELLNALRRQEQEQARNALHQPQAQEVPPIDIFGTGPAPSMDDLFMDGTNPGGVGLDINSAVAAIDTSVGGMDAVSAIHSAVPDIHSAVPDMHLAVPDLDSAAAELDSAVAGMTAGESDALFGDLPGDGGEQFPGDGPDPFASVSGTGEDRAKEQDLLANLDAGESSGMDLEMGMDLMEMGGLGIGAGESGAGGEADMSGLNIDDANMGLGDMGMGDAEIGGIEMGDGIEAIWSNFFDTMGTDIGDGIHIKAEPE